MFGVMGFCLWHPQLLIVALETALPATHDQRAPVLDLPAKQVIKLIEAVEDLKRQCGIPVSTAWAAWHGIGVVLSGLVGWHGMEFRHGIE